MGVKITPRHMKMREHYNAQEKSPTYNIRFLGTFLYNNYKQALHIISDGENSLLKLMHELGIEDTHVFEMWLAEERAYLTSLSHEPSHETLQMEYWQKLVNISGSK
jgi:hypothetical protein